MNVYFDIETIPCQSGPNNYESFLKAEKENFKAPSGLTKGQACTDLGITGNDAKFTSKDDAILKWEQKFADEKAPEVADEKWRKTSFDGGSGEIISMSWAIEDGDIKSISRALGESEPEMIQGFFDQVNDLLGKRPPFFIGQFVAGFDLKFLFHRCVVLRMPPPFKLAFNGRHDKDFFCTQIAWAGFKGRMSQDNMCKALGIEGKPGDIDGSKVWDFVKAGDVKRVEEYNRDDVFKVRELHKRLTFAV